MEMDKSWTKIRNRGKSMEFWNGLQAFMEMIRPFANDRGYILCPCRRCMNMVVQVLEDVEDHIFRHGFLESYDKWIHHGEKVSQDPSDETIRRDEMTYLLNDIAGSDTTSTDDHYDKLFDALQSELYPGVSSFSSLNFLVKIMHLKVINKWTNKSFDELLKLLKLAFPNINLVDSHYEAKKLMKKLGLGYESIHVCKNDCALFWKEHASRETCPVCSESRWEQTASKNSVRNVPHKVLRYFPIAPRLKRLFAMKDIAKLMRWHSNGRSRDEDQMNHPVDGKAWKDFDKYHPEFACELRNVRLGLAADGFNPFGNMSSSHSTWPVVLATYNLPPWLCMKPEYLMLTLLIPGPRSPGKDMDVFLRPLVDELKELWDVGVDTRDASLNNGLFKLRASLLWTVNDFPARSSLSGWSGQGYKGCPTCGDDTPSTRVIGKTAYVGHRRFLPLNHPWRSNLQFNGMPEIRSQPRRLTSTDIIEQLNRVPRTTPGKHPSYGGVKRKRCASELNWRKKSIFYELSYWSTIELKHNIDIMHVEKNVCDSLLGTMLDDPYKSKDTDNARRDLMNLKIKEELHLYQQGSRLMKPHAEYVMTPGDRKKFCNFIKSVKFPDAFAANLRKNVASNESRLQCLKSHDSHIIMQRLLPVGCRAYLNKTISSTIIELCTFFKQLCARSLKVSDMLMAQEQLVFILCKLERIFPPAFFDIMIHVVMHLPEEAILGGPVYMRWMYPFERYMKKMKDYVRNPAKPEGSIAEGYVVDEALTFCSRYFEDVETRFNRADRNVDVDVPKRQISVFESKCRPLGKGDSVLLDNVSRNQAEFYILNNCPEIVAYLQEHKCELQKQGCANVDQGHKTGFPAWFYSKIYALQKSNPAEVTRELMSLGSRSHSHVASYTACVVNGVRFLTLDRDSRRRTQNSGVSVPGTDGNIFYGQLKEILELSYLYDLSIVLFRCKWFKTDGKRKVVEKNITSIDTSVEDFKDDQFILATQAKQVFYIEDPSRGPNWRVVQEVNHRSTWDIPQSVITEIDLLHDNNSSNFSLFVDLGNLEHIPLHRQDSDSVPADGTVNEGDTFIDDHVEDDDTDEENSVRVGGTANEDAMLINNHVEDDDIDEDDGDDEDQIPCDSDSDY